MRDEPIKTADGFYVRAVQYIVQHTPELANMIKKGLQYLSKEFSSVRKRLYSAPDHPPTNQLQEYMDSSNLNNEVFRKRYIRKPFTAKHRHPFNFSK